MAKGKITITASALVLLLLFGVACMSLAAPSLSAPGEQRSRLPQRCAAGMACDQLIFTCSFGFPAGLSSVPNPISSLPNNHSRNSQLLAAKGYPSSVLEEIYLTSGGCLSAYQMVFPQKISIHLLNSVLTL